MVSLDVRFHLPRLGTIASLAVTMLSLPSRAIAVPAPLSLAYYRPTVNAHELYIRPLWFGRSESEADPVNSTAEDVSIEAIESLEIERSRPSRQVPTESDSDSDPKPDL